MKKNIVVWMALGFVVLSGSAIAYGHHKPLLSYEALLQALNAGDDVKAIIHFDKCKAKDNQDNVVRAEGALNFNVFNHYQLPTGKYVIATSTTVFTEHRDFGPVSNYVRLRVHEDNSTEVYIAFYDPNTHVKKNAIEYLCQLNADKQSGLSLYDLTAY